MSFSGKEKKRISKARPSRVKGDVTLDIVAKVAGVSAITVSRAINKPEKLAPETRERVEQAIAKTGYVPNLLAGGLASRSSKLIAAIIPSIANLVYAETISLFSNRFREAGYQVILGDSGYPEVLEEELVRAILTRRPDGILLTGVDHSPVCRNLLLSARIPVVETWDLTPSPLDIVVGFDHVRIGREVAKFIIEKGYRSAGFVSADDARALTRQRSTQETLIKHGVTNIVTASVPVPSSMELGRLGTRQLLDKGFTGGAIFCSSDTLAQGVLAELQSRDIGVPEKIGIIGFGDQVFAAFTHPPLTTVRIDRKRIGREAVDALLARIAEQPIKNNIIDVGFEIISRQTM